MKRVLLVVPLFLACFLVAPAPAAHACSCVMLSTEEQVGGADLVARGTIVATQDPEGTLPTISSARPVTHEVTVAEVYKGAPAATMFVGSAAEGASCGIEVETGREYVLFAREDGSGLRAGFCDGTRPVSDEFVAEVEAITGPGTPPQGATTSAARPASPGSAGSSAALPVGLGFGGALLASAVAGLWWRRHQAVRATVSGYGEGD